MNPFAFFLAIADKVHTALNLLDPTRTYAAADALWEDQRGAGRGRCAELLEEIRDLLQHQSSAAPASQTDAPGEASGVPEGVSTPDPDAPSGHLTLGNDPQSVYERALRQGMPPKRPCISCGCLYGTHARGCHKFKPHRK